MTEMLKRALDSLRTGFWAVPAACALMALALAIGMVEVDRSSAELGALTFGAGPDGAREVLSAITSSMITFTGLVFSITIVVLQLTSSQFSPRVLRTFLRDRQTQWSLGVFVATFVYAVMVLRTVDSSEGSVFVPALATAFGVFLLVISVGVFIGYIHHIATAIQVSSLIRAVGGETRKAIERQVPVEPATPEIATPTLPAPTRVLTSTTFGVVISIDVPALVKQAQRGDTLLVLRPALGEFVPEGAPLVEVHGDGDVDVDAVVGAVRLGKDRTMEQDVAFGFRQLVDVAERALSPGINDPTTAVQALDEVHDLLRRLVTRCLPCGNHADDAGGVRVVMPPLRLEDLISLALDEIDQYGAGSTQVQKRISVLLDDLVLAADAENRAVVSRYRRARAKRTSRPASKAGSRTRSGE